MAIEQMGRNGPSVANPLQGKDMLAELLQLHEQGTRGSQPMQNQPSMRSNISNRYRPPGQMRVRFPWARPSRGA